jgi:hypothetical protein
MINTDITNLQNEFIKHKYIFSGFIEKLLQTINEAISDISLPKQGADSIVFFVKTISGEQFAIKTGVDVSYDISALKLLSSHNIDFIPKVHFTYEYNNLYVLVTEKIEAPLYQDVPQNEKCFYLESIINRAKSIQSITNPNAGLIEDCLTGKGESWNDYLLSKYNGKHRYFSWQEIYKRNGVKQSVVEPAIQNIVQRIFNLKSLKSYSLIHSDLNQRNLFVNKTTHKIVSIIDWTESLFGDPLFEFARVRMNIRFNQPENENLFISMLKLSKNDIPLEQLYFDIHMLDYVNWYSESWNKTDTRNFRLEFILDYLNKYVH